VQPWTASRTPRRGARSVPIPEQVNVGADEVVFPHRYWIANEHCQYLNVWTQNLTPAVKKPVMVWMHGGGFTNGSSIESYAYDGRSLSEFGDVVVVSVNHRLNILGTLDLSPTVLSTRSPGIPGPKTSCRRCNGCTTTSRASAAIPAM
jgi:para-nitrobenzyl esterase